MCSSYSQSYSGGSGSSSSQQWLFRIIRPVHLNRLVVILGVCANYAHLAVSSTTGVVHSIWWDLFINMGEKRSKPANQWCLQQVLILVIVSKSHLSPLNHTNVLILQEWDKPTIYLGWSWALAYNGSSCVGPTCQCYNKSSWLPKNSNDSAPICGYCDVARLFSQGTVPAFTAVARQLCIIWVDHPPV